MRGMVGLDGNYRAYEIILTLVFLSLATRRSEIFRCVEYTHNIITS